MLSITNEQTALAIVAICALLYWAARKESER